MDEDWTSVALVIERRTSGGIVEYCVLECSKQRLAPSCVHYMNSPTGTGEQVHMERSCTVWKFILY